MLQPIVENSIYHGLKSRKGIGHIWVKANLNDNIIEFTVEDDGIGMDANLIEKINSGDYSRFSRSGVGIKNVAERIQLTFGPEYGIHIAARESSGVVVKFFVPAEFSETGVTDG